MPPPRGESRSFDSEEQANAVEGLRNHAFKPLRLIRTGFTMSEVILSRLTLEIPRTRMWWAGDLKG